MENQEFRHLVRRYLGGGLNEKEYQELLDSLMKGENQVLFDNLKKEWELSPQSDLQLLTNWKRLSYKINNSTEIQKKMIFSRRSWLQLVSAAAILVFGLIAGGIIWQFIGDHTGDHFVFQTPRGEKSKVVLSDGSEVWLNANSKLVYHSFTDHSREIDLQGEAFFKVTKNEHAPFIVHTNECDVRVLGTSFNVMAYDDFGRKEVTLIEGKIDILDDKLIQTLSPGQAFILKDKKYRVVEGNAAQASSWVDNQFNFKNIPVPELMKRLENWYDIDIKLEGASSRQMNFSGVFKNEETIWQVLDALKIYLPLEYEKTDLRKIRVILN